MLGEKGDQVRVMAKLTTSLADAVAMADPRVVAGEHGWMTINFTADDALELPLLEGWLHESFGALAPKKVLKQLVQ